MEQIARRTRADGAASRVPPKHTWAPIVLLLALVAESGHAMEHVAQVLQAKVFHIWPDQGLLGGTLTANEWTHFGYNGTFAILVTIGYLAYGKAARTEWKRISPRAYTAFWILMVAVWYHWIEHWVRIGQHLSDGKAPEPGIAGQFIDLVYFHAVMNAIELAAFVYAFTKLRLDRDVPFLERRRVAMAAQTGRYGGWTLGWRLQALALFIGPWLVILSDTIGPLAVSDATVTTTRITDAHLPFQLAAMCGLVGAMFLMAGAVGIARLCGPQSKAGIAGAALAIVGCCGLISLMGVFVIAGEAAAMVDGGAPMAPYVELARRFLEPRGMMLLPWAMTVMLAVGFSLLAAAGYFRKVIPLWSALCIGIGICGQIFGHLRFDPGVYTAGNVVFAVGLMTVGVRMAHLTWAGPNRRPAPAPSAGTIGAAPATA